MSNLIKVKNISKSFGSFLAVNDISFSLSKGEVLGFLGPNGAGKTTTMRILTGFLKPDTGSVQIKDVDIKITTIARGVSVGNELEYTDEVTLGRSILKRIPFENSLKT